MAGRQSKAFKISVKDIALIAMFASILFIQEEALTFIPNVQLTVFLLVLFSKKMGLMKTSIIIAIHVILDNLVMGSLNLFYTPAMFIGWMFIPIFITLFGRKTENPFLLGLIGGACAFLYCWMFIIPNVIFYHIDVWVYLASDIVFELILASVGFVTTTILYTPCSRLFKHFGL